MIKESRISLVSNAEHQLPVCTLRLNAQEMVTALQQADVQGLLYGISNGTCVLHGQVEPFVWLIARLVEQRSKLQSSVVMNERELEPFLE